MRLMVVILYIMREGKNQRVYERIRIDSDHIYDLSEGGIYIKTTEPKRLGALVGLELKLFENENQFVAKGRVIRIVYEKGAQKKFPPGMAIKFEPLSESDKEKIRLYIRSKKPGRK